MKAITITLLVIIGLSFTFSEIIPNFPGSQPLVIDGSVVSSNSTNNGTFVTKQVVDLFATDEPTLVITLETPAPPIISVNQFTQGSQILGGERDVILTALSGSAGRVFSSSVSGGEFSLAAPNGASGTVELQYDGVDGSTTLSPNPGLGGIDLTFDGALGFQMVAVTDVTTQFTVTVYDTSNSKASLTSQVPGTEGTTFFEYNLPFANFTGVDFTKVSAIQIIINAFDNVDFIMQEIITYGEASVATAGGDSVSGSVLPCNADYYRIKTLTGLVAGNYVRIHFNQSGEASHPTSLGSFYIVSSTYNDLESELSSNINIANTLGKLPGPNNYLYACEEVASCDIEITCELEDSTYYIAVVGGGSGWVNYDFSVNLRQAPVYELFDCVPQVVVNDRRPTQPPDDRTLDYRFFAINVPKTSDLMDGTYLVVNISRVQQVPLEIRLSYGGLPGSRANVGVWDVNDVDSQGVPSDYCTTPYCVDTEGSSYYYPVNTEARGDCVSTSTQHYIGNAVDGAPFQLTTSLTVDPCQMKYGTWYVSVLLPARLDPVNDNDTSGYANYTITACVVQPTITALERNITQKGWVIPEAQSNYYIDVPSDEVVHGETHLFVQISNVRNGRVNVWIHSANSAYPDSLAGGPEGCQPANVTCNTCDACNLVIEKCHFHSGRWFLSVSIDSFDDFDRLPITYTLRANWMEDTAPVPIVSGIPVSNYIGASLYDFYVVDVPPTIDTWMFIELYTKACDTEVIISVLHGSLPGGECYSRPDFYCMTGDPREISFTTNIANDFVTKIPKQRESCTFMIQTCELAVGPLYISVYGQRQNYEAYGDTTYYQIPVHYTLYVDFDTALSLQSGLSYSETVYDDQYQHYYIRADRVLEGSYLTVEVTNIQHAFPQAVEVYVNYNYLAGDCPCYEHLYNATGAVLPGCGNQVPDLEQNYIPQINSVDTCATIIVPACDFRPGVWYVSVLGKNQELTKWTTPIGYTLTVTVHDAPVFHPLILGQSTVGEVPQWNKTLEYTNYKLAAAPLPLFDLVLKLTYVQNCEYQEKHDNLRDTLVMYVHAGGPAGDRCYDYTCSADIEGFSYCTVVIPHCDWQNEDYFIAIKGDYDADFTGRFTLRASLDEVRFTELTSSVSVYGRVPESRYNHYFIASTGDRTQSLVIDLYTNNDQDAVDVYLNVDEPAGAYPCFRYVDACVSENSCSFLIETCDLEKGRYYVSVYGNPHQFYDISTEYSLTATFKPVATSLTDGNPVTASVKAGQDLHYKIEVDSVSPGDFLLFEIDNVQHGSVAVFYEFGSIAGRCPCYLYEMSCYADSSDVEWCEIRVPSCEFQAGNHFFTVKGLENDSPSALACATDIGYTIEVNIIKPNIITPNFVVGKNVDNTEYFQFIANGRYNHYQIDYTQQDFDAGYHVIVEITSVRDGALFVYFTPDFPGDENSDCHLAQICTSGLGAGSSCYWQVPFCLSKPRKNQFNELDTTLYVTVEGMTGRLQASYNILIYKQAVPEIIADPLFTLDNTTSSTSFPANTELNVTHFKQNEPNGWTQFIKLENVPAHVDALNGELLEVYFYRIINDYYEPMSFNVYLFPNRPAGAHECCDSADSNLGSCQGSPCLTTVDLTTRVDYGKEYYTHTCNLPAGSGTGPDNIPFYGENCTITVWPCEYNRYDCSEVSTWWLAVVPISPTDAASSLPGLSYSVQWRSRNIRLQDTTTVGTISLNQYVNTYNYTPVFYVESITTEREGWLSFILDFTDSPISGRLSIQTQFVNGSSVVYIAENSFASPVADIQANPECAQYYCASDANSDCDTTGRFLATTCNLQEQYYITVRNVGPAHTYAGVQFRIVFIHDTDPVVADDHLRVSSPFVAASGISQYNVVGVMGEDYDFYDIPIDDTDLAAQKCLIIDVQRRTNDTGSLQLFFRQGARAGTSTGLSQDFYSGDEDCYGYQYTCTIDVGGRCIFQIPPTQLIQGNPWSLSIYNPYFNFATPTDLPEYTLSVYFQDSPTQLTLGVPQVQTNASTTYLLPGTYYHFSVNVTESDLEFQSTTYESYYTRKLRFLLTGFTNNIVSMFVNYGDLAGAESDTYPFYADISSGDITCTDDTTCYFDIYPCQSSFKLVTGVYYVSLLLSAPSTYNLTAYMVERDYTVLQPSAIAGTGQRASLTDHIWTVTPSNADLAGHGDGSGIYRYALNTFDSGVTDLSLYYFQINISVPTNTTGSVSLQVWRDCDVFVCFAGPGTPYCVIDAVTNDLCTTIGGIFYLSILNTDDVQFTLTFSENEALVQTVNDRQLFVDEIFPYQYYEYFYPSSFAVLEGSTLTVRVCALCGEVEAWVRPDLPAGPGNAITPWQCEMDHCVAKSTDSDQYFDDDDDNVDCCIMFLDTCQYTQRGYYVAIRGLDTSFPANNEHLYLPAKYSVEVIQTNIQVTDINFCPGYVSYNQPTYQAPQQFAVNLESANVGAMLRFTMVVPSEYVPPSGVASVMSIAWNRTVGYTTACEDLTYSCEVYAGSTTCSFVVPPCDTHTGRYYIWADAPRGTEVSVERWDPVIPIINTDVQYHASINAPAATLDFPFMPAYQIYTFNYGPVDDEDSHDDDYDHFYDKFFVRVRVQNVQHGSIRASINTGYAPVLPDTSCSADWSAYMDSYSCTVAEDGYDCFIDIQRNNVNFSGEDDDNEPEYDLQTRFWLVIEGLEQQCELHSVQYSFTVQTSWVIRYFNLDTTVCDNVEEDEYNFYRLRPHAVELPQQSYLHFSISDIDTVEGDEVVLSIMDHYVPTLDSNTVWERSGRASSLTTVPPLAGSIDLDWICRYDNLYFSVYGINSDDGNVDYRFRVESIPVAVKELFNNGVYHADDDDDDVCPHEHDFYIFKAVAPHGNYQTSFLRVSTESECPIEVYVNKEGFAWEQCYVAHGTADRGTLNLYDFCDYEDTIYYITVVAQCNYYIYTNVIDSAVSLTLGEVYRDSLEDEQYHIYTLEVCKDWIRPDDRLIVEIADVSGGNVYGWIQRDSNPGPYQSVNGDGYCDISASSRATAVFGNGQSGYDYLIVNHCELQAGFYHILIRADPRIEDDTDLTADDDDRNQDRISYRLLPYLESYHVDIIDLQPGVTVSSAVDLYTVDRIEPDSLKYSHFYRVHPHINGYEDGISFAQVNIQNVKGGLVETLVKCGSLATLSFDYIPGSVYNLNPRVSNQNMRSGHFPYNMQYLYNFADSDINPMCSGCSDFCASMDYSYDGPSQFSNDQSLALFIPSCYFTLSAELFVAVYPISEMQEQVPVSYDLTVSQYVDYLLLQPNTNRLGEMTNGNWEYHFYRSLQAEIQSARWRVVVTEGEGVLVTVRNNRCPMQATWTREIWCDSKYFSNKWECDIEIPTAAAHPGDNAFFITVYGKNASYSIAYWRGRENCHDFFNDGYSEGLDFCAGLVPYTTWRWDDYSILDNEARCFFEELYGHFKVQPCWSGVTTDCNTTLQRFACYESFRRCDEYGFYVGTCRKACNAVVYECVNWFESVNLEHYNCSSSRYIDEGAYTCTGSDEFETFTPGNANLFFPADPNLILYDDIVFINSAPVLSISFFLALALFLVL